MQHVLVLLHAVGNMGIMGGSSNPSKYAGYAKRLLKRLLLFLCGSVYRYTVHPSLIIALRLQSVRDSAVLGVVPGATQQPASYLR